MKSIAIFIKRISCYITWTVLGLAGCAVTLFSKGCAGPTGTAALNFTPDDPLYGQVPPGKEDNLFLGQMAIQGERDLLKIPYSFLVRLRYNPFYTFLEMRALEWIDNTAKK
jgi:hypothetical protein